MTRFSFLFQLKSLALSVTLISIGLSIPPLRSLIELSMFWHMVVQIPLLIVAGGLLMAVSGRLEQAHAPVEWNLYGLSGFIFGLVVITYWMLPSAVDRAIVIPGADALKIVSLLCCGALLRHSVTRSPAVIQLFFLGNVIAMITWLGFYFIHTDLRLCNAYSLESQIRTGWGLVAMGPLIFIGWLCMTFGKSPDRPASTGI
jgi:hypothetical protein